MLAARHDDDDDDDILKSLKLNPKIHTIKFLIITILEFHYPMLFNLFRFYSLE